MSFLLSGVTEDEYTHRKKILAETLRQAVYGPEALALRQISNFFYVDQDNYRVDLIIKSTDGNACSVLCF